MKGFVVVSSLKKRGQVTYFIVVGILLVIAVGGFLYFRAQKEKIEAPLEEMDPELLPINTFVKSCLERDLVEGILILGAQGGYIKFPNQIAINPRASLASTQFGNLKIPYWYYEGQNRVPTLQHMEEDLGNYVKENIRFCLRDFEAFSGKFSIDQPLPEDVSVDVRIGEKDVRAELTYPLQIHIGGEDGFHQREKFNLNLPVGLKRVYDLAVRVMERENREMFFENLTIELMTLSDGRPPNGIPFSDLIFQCGSVEWSKPQVIQSIKNLLFYNLPRVQVENTDAPGFDREDTYGKNHLVWDVLAEEEADRFQDLGVGFYYAPEFPAEVYINPSQGNTLKASYGRGGFDYLKYICVNAYHFTYTMTYPIVVNIVDESAFADKGFVFRFATPILVDHNQGNRKDFTITQFERPETDRDFCKRKQDKLFSVYAKDKMTGEDILDVNVTFSCVNTYDCYLGKTRNDGGVGRLSTLLPAFCSPGSVVVTHQDYATARKQLSPTNLEQRYVDVPLVPLKPLTLRVQKRKLINRELQDPISLEPGEYAVIFLNTQELEDFGSMREYPQLHGYTESQESYLDNLGGDLSKINLAKDRITYELNIVLLNADNEPIGGFIQDWTPDPNQIAGAEEVMLTVIEQIPHPINALQQAQMMMVLEDEKITKQIEHAFR